MEKFIITYGITSGWGGGHVEHALVYASDVESAENQAAICAIEYAASYGYEIPLGGNDFGRPVDEEEDEEGEMEVAEIDYYAEVYDAELHKDIG